ncbi:hypothetical protein M1M38_gp097 [Halorubrum tailed virus 27]|uniref:Uncharacterized protein n=1 Tax=Halorubrum tailed virus 27 TaxID=2878008 RepID=A0AAE8XYT7_9CAUD|nr:hypothetical protein M1M38_gp097 [Halorubrum tailed virus 27]UBF22790.1 hypothetical protein HRTV-27_gp97 [Halorubrum tailed virus 27]
MSYKSYPTDVLLSTYYHADLIAEGLIPGDKTLADVTDMLLELDARGVCVREETPPTWYTFYADPENRDTIAPRP